MEDTVYIAVHPGYGFESDEYQELDGLRSEDYFRHNHEFFRDFERALESDAEIAVMSETGTDYSREYLGELSEEVDYFFETVSGKGKLSYNDVDGFIEFISDLNDNASVTVSGELHNLCHGQVRQIVEYVGEMKGKGIETRRGVVFPDNPLERDDENNLKFTERRE